DLILLDLNMPRLHGLDVLRQIRAHADLRTVPGLVLTTSARPEDVRQTYAAGANTYIEKPHDSGRCVEVLQTIQHFRLDTARPPPGRLPHRAAPLAAPLPGRGALPGRRPADPRRRADRTARRGPRRRGRRAAAGADVLRDRHGGRLPALRPAAGGRGRRRGRP